MENYTSIVTDGEGDVKPVDSGSLKSVPLPRSSRDARRFSSNDDLELHLSSPQFSYLEALKSFVYHIFAPISVPFMWAIEGKQYTTNTMFIFPKEGGKGMFVPGCLSNYLTHLVVCAVLAAYARGLTTNVMQIEVAAVVVIHLARLAVVAEKYGVLLADPYWDKKIRHTYITLAESSEVLLTSWVSPADSRVIAEVEVAEQRAGVRLDQLFFFGGGAPVLRARDLVITLLTSVSKLPHLRKLNTVFAVTLAALPTAYRFSRKIFVLSPLDWCCVILTAILVFMLFGSLLSFLNAAYCDYRRRELSLATMTFVIKDSLSDHTQSIVQRLHSLNPTERFSRGLNLPYVCLSSPQNVEAWMATHLTLRLFAGEVKMRAAIFTTTAALCNVVIIGVLLAQILTSKHKLNPLSVAYALIFATAISLNILLIFARAVRANAQVHEQSRSLLSVLFRLHSARQPPVPPCYEKALAMIDVAVRTVVAEDAADPITVFGIRASPGALRAIFAGIASVAGALFQLLFVQSSTNIMMPVK
jgi:hypothetical protein